MNMIIVSLMLAAGPTADFVNTVSPDLPDSFVSKISASVEQWSKHYSVDPLLLAAILRQESDFRTGLKSCWIVERYQRCEVTCDYGIAQVNQLWIKKWKLDPHRLQHDISYNIRVAARILAGLQKQYSESDPEWYGRYHSGTYTKKKKYLKKLQTFLVMR